MKNSLLLFVLQIASLCAVSQPTIQWKKAFGGTDNDFARSIIQSTDGGFVTAGGVLSADGDITGHHGSFDFWVVKTDAAGTVQWQKALGGTGYDFAYCIQQTSDGGFIVAGWSDSNDGDVTGNHGDTDIWVVKLSAAGAIQWQKSIGGSASDFAYSIHQNNDGSYVIAGRTYSANGDVTVNKGAHDLWVIKLDVTGAISWQKTYGGSNNEYGYSIKQTFFDGGYIVVGNTNSTNGDVTGNHGLDDAWVLKLDGAGNVQWKKAIGGTGEDFARLVEQTGDQGFIFVGETQSNDGDVSGNHGQTDCWVVKMDAAGTIQWQKTYGGTLIDIGNSIQQSSDGGYIVAAWSASIDGDITAGKGGADYWLMKLTPQGAISWQQNFGGTSTDYAYSVRITSDGGFVVAGNSSSTDLDVTGNHGSFHDVWIVKFNGLPLSLSNELSQALGIYPNPSSGLFNFVNVEPDSKIEIYDITGRVILTTIIKDKTFQFDLSDKSNGIYFYKITGNKPLTGKLIKH